MSLKDARSHTLDRADLQLGPLPELDAKGRSLHARLHPKQDVDEVRVFAPSRGRRHQRGDLRGRTLIDSHVTILASQFVQDDDWWIAFYEAEVRSELGGQSAGANPMVTADAIKFAATNLKKVPHSLPSSTREQTSR